MAGHAVCAQSYDLLISGGRVLDGTGNPAMYADVAIRDGKIAAVGHLRGRAAARVIDAKGIIAWSYLSPVAVNPGADGILDALEQLHK